MTTPLLVEIAAGVGPDAGDEFTISAFIAPTDQPPPPSNENVAIQRMPPLRVFVAAYSSYVTERAVIRHAGELADSVVRAGRSIANDAPIYSAAYESPYRLVGRHNEVWLPAE